MPQIKLKTVLDQTLDRKAIWRTETRDDQVVVWTARSLSKVCYTFPLAFQLGLSSLDPHCILSIFDLDADGLSNTGRQRNSESDSFRDFEWDAENEWM